MRASTRWLVVPLLASLLGFACSGKEPNAGPASEELGTDSREIVGGITDHGHAYVVGVGDASGPFCSGTLISKRTVITAGHCYGGITKVWFGVKADSTGTVVSVAKETRHPGFDRSSLANDLSVLKLAADAPVQPSALLRETMTDEEFVGPDFTFVGYGITSGYGTGMGTRRVVTFPIVNVGPATLASGGTTNTIDETMFYYRLVGENTCNGDSGGPAFAVRGKVEYHAGTTSFGDGPCKLDGVNARTDAAAIANFIQAEIDANEGTADDCRSNGICDETCNVNGKLVDPDCAEAHCGQDGVCSLACVLPKDPDCAPAPNTDFCKNDGVCDPSCATHDVDCRPLCATEGTCIQGCTVPDADCGGPGPNPPPPPPLPSSEAAYDAALKAPACATAEASCDSASLLVGRATVGKEPNTPNTLDACKDGASGTFHKDESVDRIVVSSLDGEPLTAGKEAKVEVTVWAYSTFTSDRLELFITSDLTAPAWTAVTSVTPTASGQQTLTTTVTLPTGVTQAAVRAQFRYQGSSTVTTPVSVCVAGGYNDRDDLVLTLKQP